MIITDLSDSDTWILSDSIVNWADPLVSFFDLVVFVYVPQEIRIDRLMKREYKRYGDKARQGGERYEASQAFLQWAASYDAGTKNGPSLAKHEQWLSDMKCPTLRIVNNELEDSVQAVINAILN